MVIKRLRKSKNIATEKAEEISGVAKELVFDLVRKQQIETMKLPAEFDDVATEINTLGYSFLRYIYEVNDYFAAISGKQNYKNEKTEICSFVGYLCKKAEPFMSKKEIKLVCKVLSENIFVNIDREHFSYVFFGILLNAAEHSLQKAKIRISVSSTKKFVKIVITDNGRGITEENIVRCCEPFFSETEGNRTKKIGLGLTLAHYFITENNGRMNISSERGKGTSVSLLLPICERGGELAVWSPKTETFGENLLPEYIMLSGIGKEE